MNKGEHKIQAPGKVSLDTLMTYPDWDVLTLGQQRFVIAYISGGYNKIDAIKASGYKYKDEESARVKSYQVLKTTAVSTILSLHYGESPASALAKIIRSRILRGTLKKQDLEGLRLYAELKGLTSSSHPLEPDTKQEGNEDLVPPDSYSSILPGPE